MNDVLDIVKFEKAPCYRCGYNGHSYYQPGTHACAKDYHRIRDLMEELADPLIAAQRVFLLERDQPEAAKPLDLTGIFRIVADKFRDYPMAVRAVEECQARVLDEALKPSPYVGDKS